MVVGIGWVCGEMQRGTGDMGSGHGQSLTSKPPGDSAQFKQVTQRVRTTHDAFFFFSQTFFGPAPVLRVWL